MSAGESIRSSARWLLSGNVASQVLQFAFGIVMARLLDPSDFGLLVTIQVFTGLAAFVSGAGMGQALVQSPTVTDHDFQAVFTFQLMMGLLIYAAFFAIAPWFAVWFGHPIYSDLLRVSALYFAIRPFGNLANVWMHREMQFKRKTIVAFGASVLAGSISMGMAWMGFAVWSLVFGGLISTVVATGVILALVPVRPRLRFDLAALRRLGTYGFKTTLNDFVSYARAQAPNFVISRVAGPAMVGLYNKADSMARMPSLIGNSVYDPIFRSMAKIQGDKDTCRYMYFRTIGLLAVYMLPCFVGLAWLSEPLIVLLYGPKWIDVAAPLSILCLGGLFVCIGSPSGAVLAAQNWLGREALVQASMLALVVAAAYFGLRWGLVGVAWGMLAAHAYSTFHLNWLVNRCIRATYTELIRSLVPGLLLNSILVAVLATVDFLLPSTFATEHRLAYVLAMSSTGATIYALAFLVLPHPALATEQIRWKSHIAAVLHG